MPNTVHLHRVLSAPIERVFRAFSDPDALAKWLPPNGFVAKIHQFDFREGGSYRMSFTNFTSNTSNSFGGKYLEIKPNELLRYVDKFDDPTLAGEMHVTISFHKVVCGTDLKVIQEGIPDVIPVEMCYVGWQQSLNALTQLVEPEIQEDI